MGRKIKNPLEKRVPRELIGDWSKYLVVSLFLILTIGFVSGMYVANGSMMKAADDGVTEYKMEDGHFELGREAGDDLLAAIEGGEVPVSLYENFYRNEEEDNNNDGTVDGTVRVFPETEDINLACLMEGSFPETENEICIDRMHADNSDIRVGDTITVSGQKYEITGLIAYVNYATLHEKNTDMMFDALKFNVAMVTEAGFNRLSNAVHYSYAWKYEKTPADETEEKKRSDDFLEQLVTEAMKQGVSIEDYIPRYANAAFNFATDDMGSDEAMGGVLLDILIVIIAFIFAVTISNKIAQESTTIGTLRASGYSKGELIRHYLSMPVIVTLISAVVGNILGYTLFKNVVVSMYYNSYSLPEYKTIWNPEAFFKTTFIPIVLMIVVNLIVITKMLQHTPLQFLRKDLKKKKRSKAMRLPRWKFFNRFRLRIMIQNIPNYFILFVGILFIMVLLAMAVGMPATLDYYQDKAEDMMFAKYQYVLKSCKTPDGNIVSTENDDAEQFAMCALLRKGENMDEEISVYGVSDDSKYISIGGLDSLDGNKVYISTSYSEKYNVKEGDTIRLDEKYEDKQYEFYVEGIYDKCLSQNLAVFMPINTYRHTFEIEEDEFVGYMSNTEISDIAEENIATVITKRDVTKMCDQLDHSMGAYMQYFQVLCTLLSAVLIYLLTKIIIEKNENAISMTKILGYENKEIAGLYMFSTTIWVVVASIASVFLGTAIMNQAWKVMMADFSGWISFHFEAVGYLKMFTFVLIGYLIVMIFDFKRIKRIPMDEALKNVE
ncbi:MAG: FtsX-like permease family protein [Clostridium sp.]|nr:FtsX-like permease family protein [Clostridium sp.]MCM1398350.1 FtsX-like permease family protein [Clostridium sp.]MCM1458985.1 FtsX-like permease family protein [Bacteroides sp.]